MFHRFGWLWAVLNMWHNLSLGRNAQICEADLTLTDVKVTLVQLQQAFTTLFAFPSTCRLITPLVCSGECCHDHKQFSKLFSL